MINWIVSGHEVDILAWCSSKSTDQLREWLRDVLGVNLLTNDQLRERFSAYLSDEDRENSAELPDGVEAVCENCEKPAPYHPEVILCKACGPQIPYNDIQKLVRYNWEKEEADFNAWSEENPGEDQHSQIFPSMVKIQDWLDAVDKG
jgi:hypothetical protein